MHNKILTLTLTLFLACAGFALGHASQSTQAQLDSTSMGAGNHSACVMPRAKSASDNSMNDAMMAMMAADGKINTDGRAG